MAGFRKSPCSGPPIWAIVRELTDAELAKRESQAKKQPRTMAKNSARGGEGDHQPARIGWSAANQ